MAAKTYSEYIKWCKKTKRWPVAGKHVWEAATKAAEEKFKSANTQSKPCCPKCGEGTTVWYQCGACRQGFDV